MKTKIKTDWAMFSKEGNEAVTLIVHQARVHELDWVRVEQKLRNLAKNKGYEEAMDTMVRELVYCFLGFHKRKNDFRI